MRFGSSGPQCDPITFLHSLDRRKPLISRDRIIAFLVLVTVTAGIARAASINWPLAIEKGLPMSLLFVGPDREHRTDAEMAELFRTHGQDFERLVAMLRADSTVDFVVAHDPWSGPPPNSLPRSRSDEYKCVMRPLHVVSISRESHDVVVFRSTTTYTFDRKGWLWSGPAIEPCACGDVPSAETTDPRNSALVRAHKPIAPHWYIYYQTSS